MLKIGFVLLVSAAIILKAGQATSHAQTAPIRVEPGEVRGERNVIPVGGGLADLFSHHDAGSILHRWTSRTHGANSRWGVFDDAQRTNPDAAAQSKAKPLSPSKAK